MTLFAPRDAVFSFRIGAVVGVITQEEMGGVAARRVVAVMANESAGWDGAVLEFPGDPMGAARYAIHAD